jgi:hypothetical protein
VQADGHASYRVGELIETANVRASEDIPGPLGASTNSSETLGEP